MTVDRHWRPHRLGRAGTAVSAGLTGPPRRLPARPRWTGRAAVPAGRRAISASGTWSPVLGPRVRARCDAGGLGGVLGERLRVVVLRRRRRRRRGAVAAARISARVRAAVWASHSVPSSHRPQGRAQSRPHRVCGTACVDRGGRAWTCPVSAGVGPPAGGVEQDASRSTPFRRRASFPVRAGRFLKPCAGVPDLSSSGLGLGPLMESIVVIARNCHIVARRCRQRRKIRFVAVPAGSHHRPGHDPSDGCVGTAVRAYGVVSIRISTIGVGGGADSMLLHQPRTGPRRPCADHGAPGAAHGAATGGSRPPASVSGHLRGVAPPAAPLAPRATRPPATGAGTDLIPPRSAARHRAGRGSSHTSRACWGSDGDRTRHLRSRRSHPIHRPAGSSSAEAARCRIGQRCSSAQRCAAPQEAAPHRRSSAPALDDPPPG